MKVLFTSNIPDREKEATWREEAGLLMGNFHRVDADTVWDDGNLAITHCKLFPYFLGGMV